MTEQVETGVSTEDQAAEKPSRLRRAFGQLRIKLTLPYAFLALAVAFSATFLVTRLLVGVLENRFETALIDAGHKAADTVVRIEQEQLAGLRSIAYTDGFGRTVAERDADTASRLATPHVLNAGLDCVEVLDIDASPLLAMHHVPGGGVADYTSAPGSSYADWDIVQRVLNGVVDEAGDKYADLIETEWGTVFYTAGPVRDGEETVGALVVGTYLDHLAQRLDAAALARVTVYLEGEMLPRATTLAPEEPEALALDEPSYLLVLATQSEQVIRRDVQVAGRGYAEVMGPFEARHGRDLGVLSTAIPLEFVTQAQHPTRQYLLGLFGAATILVLIAGALVASMVVRRVRRLAAATQQVARGDLSTQVEIRGADEVATLASDFNDMVVQLREGRLYRDLLGLTTSPEVADRLRDGVQKGVLKLRAQSVVATVLFIDIRGFTRLSEGRDPEYVLHFLNDYLQGLVRIIREHHGVINKFIGDAALAFFGILPESRSPSESAKDALAAAVGIEEYLVEFNRQRELQGEQTLRVGTGINTGPVVAGTLGSEERLEYTILGDTVNVAQRLSDLSKEHLEYQLFVSADTCYFLDEHVRRKAVDLGPINVKGRSRTVNVYAIPRG
jgi:adenylate cyclase